MAGKGNNNKGQGKGKRSSPASTPPSSAASETWDQRIARLTQEESDHAKQAKAAKDRLANAQNRGDWQTAGKDGKAVKPGKGAGKGSGKSSFTRSNQANVVVQQTTKQLADAADKALQAAADRKVARDDKQQAGTDRAAQNAERNRLKKEQRDAGRAAQGPRETQICLNCTFKGTYATSKRCLVCTIPFAVSNSAAPASPPPSATPAAPPPPVLSPAGDAAVQALTQIKADSAARLVTFAQVTAAPIVRSPAPAPALLPACPAVATAAPAGAPAAAPPPPPPPPPGTPPAAAQLALSPDMVEAKQLLALRAEHSKTVAQKAAFADAPAVLTALSARATELDLQITALLAKRQLAMEPHQIAAVLSQRQLELGQATKAAADLDVAANGRMATFDKQAHSINDGFIADVKAILAAQEAAKMGFVAEREALWVSLNAEIQTARDKVTSLQALVNAADTANLRHNTNAQSAAQVAAQATADAAAAAAHQHEALRLQLVAQQQSLADTKAALDVQAAALNAQQQVMQQAAIRPLAVLPPAALPADPDVALGLYRLRQSLLLLAQQESVVLVSWENLATSSLSWDECIKLVPAAVVAESISDLDHILGPDLTSAVPRRVLELIRAQLDALAAEWLKSNAEVAAKAELTEQVNAWTQSTLDQARRLQTRKRPDAPPDVSPELAKVAKPATEASQSSHGIAPTQVDPSQASQPPQFPTVAPTQIDPSQPPAEQSSQPLPQQATPPSQV